MNDIISTREVLADLRAKEAAARAGEAVIDTARWRTFIDPMTPGPWGACHGDAGTMCKCGLVWSRAADMPVLTVMMSEELMGGPSVNNVADGPGVAHMRNTYAALLDEVDRLQAVDDTARELHDENRELTEGFLKACEMIGVKSPTLAGALIEIDARHAKDPTNGREREIRRLQDRALRAGIVACGLGAVGLLAVIAFAVVSIVRGPAAPAPAVIPCAERAP